MAGFYYKGNLRGGQESAVVHRIIANSETVTLGDIVKNSSGYLAVSDANDTPILGVVVGIVTSDGRPLSSSSVTTDDYDGTYSGNPGVVGSETYAASADNVTDKQVKAIVNIDPDALWKNDADSDLTEAMVFSFFSLVDEDQIDGDTNSTTAGELQLLKRDPDDESDNSQGLFKISSSALYSYEPET